MSRQFLLLQSLCVFLTVSSAFGGELPDKIKLEYTYCYEMTGLVVESSTIDLPEALVDNICLDEHKTMYHFLSSEQGGTISYITAPKAGMNVVFLIAQKMGMKLNWPSRDTVAFVCQFAERAHALRIYNDIYESLALAREGITIGRIEKLISNPDKPYGSHRFRREVLTQKAGLYTELYKKRRTVFIFKEENENGDAGNPGLIYLADRINISDVLVNNNVVMRFAGYPALTIILTFGDKSEADQFCNLSQNYVDPDIEVPIPSSLLRILDETRV